jgi:hypothetical protein
MASLVSGCRFCHLLADTTDADQGLDLKTDVAIGDPVHALIEEKYSVVQMAHRTVLMAACEISGLDRIR